MLAGCHFRALVASRRSTGCNLSRDYGMTEVVGLPFSVLLDKYMWLYSGFPVRCFLVSGIKNATFQAASITLISLVDKIACDFMTQLDLAWHPSLVPMALASHS